MWQSKCDRSILAKFNNCFQNFQLPDKSQSNLVSFYYAWKKTRTHVSLIDQYQLNTKNSSNSEINDIVETNCHSGGSRKVNNGLSNDLNNLSENEDSLETNLNQPNNGNYDDDLDENDDDDDENFNVT